MKKNEIRKEIELEAPVSRVWRALTDHKEFGAWFGVNIEVPFRVGEKAYGQMNIEGYTHLRWEVTVKAMEKEKLFSFTWHPYAIDPKVDYSRETPTLVEFRLEKKGEGTLLVATESGFDKIPAHRQIEALRMNEEGWIYQMQNIERWLDEKP